MGFLFFPVWVWGSAWGRQSSAKILSYIEFTISFLIGRKRTVNFRSQRLWCHLVADNTIIMSRTLKVTGNHVMYDSGAWFLRVIKSSSWAFCCLLSAKKQKHDFHFCFFVQCIIKQLLDSVFVISRIIKVSVRVISISLWLRLITPTLTLIILDTTKTLSNNCLLLFIH